MDNTALKIDFKELPTSSNQQSGLFYRIDFGEDISDDEGNEITNLLTETFQKEKVLVFAQLGRTFMEGFFDNTCNIDHSKIKDTFEHFAKKLKHNIVKCTFTKVD